MWMQSNLLKECSSENQKKYGMVAIPVLTFEIIVPLIFLSLLVKKFREGNFKSKD
jgi:hypothetical protein